MFDSLYRHWLYWKFPVTVVGDKKNLPPLIICRRRRAIDVLLMRQMFECPLYMPNRLTEEISRKALHDCRENPQRRRAIFVETTSQTQSYIGLIKMDEDAMRLAAKMSAVLENPDEDIARPTAQNSDDNSNADSNLNADSNSDLDSDSNSNSDLDSDSDSDSDSESNLDSDSNLNSNSDSDSDSDSNDSTEDDTSTERDENDDDDEEHGGMFTPAYIVERGGLWRRHMAIYLGKAQPLPPANSPLPQIERAISDGLETAAIRTDTPNITRSFIEWGARHQWERPLFADFLSEHLTYHTFFRSAWALGEVLSAEHPNEKRIGVMLPSSTGAALLFYTLLSRGYTPVMLNPLAGERNLISACRTAEVSCIYTSSKLLKNSTAAEKAVHALNDADINVICLEDLRPKITPKIKLIAAIAATFPTLFVPHLAGANARGDDEAVILFTSGSEGHPKGVALSHNNLQLNAAQVLARVGDLRGQKMLNTLPVFHSFGLLAGVILPCMAGITAMQYPSPLHYRVIPDIINRFRPHIFFSADSFLSQYGKQANPLDLISLQLVYAGAEKLKESTRRLWMDKFGVRIMEGYGVTEMSPAAALNTASDNRPGTVGRALSGIKLTLKKAADIKKGGILQARGPNVMLGYFYANEPGELTPPPNGIHDTGDVVEIDDDGYIRIIGRARRFIKVSGEMVPMDGVEEILHERWPGFLFAVVSVTDETRGEKLIVVTNNDEISREQMTEAFSNAGLPAIWIPRKIINIKEVPQLPTGKINYPAATKMAKQAENADEENKEDGEKDS